MNDTIKCQQCETIIYEGDEYYTLKTIETKVLDGFFGHDHEVICAGCWEGFMEEFKHDHMAQVASKSSITLNVDEISRYFTDNAYTLRKIDANSIVTKAQEFRIQEE